MISQYLGFDSDFLILGLTIIVLILFIMMIVVLVQTHNLKKNYGIFMTGKNAKNLEEILVTRLNQVDDLLETSAVNSEKVDHVSKLMGDTFQKYGLVKYNALDEMGGKLSFTLAMLNERNDGFVLNAVHSSEGCYTYIKEIIAGNSISTLAKEEREALEIAKGSQKTKRPGIRKVLKRKPTAKAAEEAAPEKNPEQTNISVSTAADMEMEDPLVDVEDLD